MPMPTSPGINAMGTKSNSSARGSSSWAWLLLLGLLVYNTFIGGSPYGLYFFLPRLITQSLYLGLIVLWLVILLLHRSTIPANPLDVPLLALGGIILLSALLSRDLVFSLNDAVLYFTYVMFYYMVLERLRAGWPMTAFVKALVMTISILCLFALLEYLAWYVGLPLFPDFRQGWWTIGGRQDPLPPYWYRLQYTLANPNLAAALLAYTLPLGAAAAVAARSRWRRANALLWLALCGVVLVTTFSRGGWLAAGAGLLAFMGLLARRWANLATIARWRFMWLAVPLVLLVAGLVIYKVLPELRRPGSDESRLAMWQYALIMIREHPLIGSGPRTYGARLLDYWDAAEYPIQYVFLGSAHNVPLQAAAELGIPGALLVVIVAVLVLRAGYRAIFHLPREQSVWMAGLLASLVAFAIHSMLETLLSIPAVMLPVVMTAGICCHGAAQPGRPGHRWFTPARGLGLSILVIAWVALSLYGMAALVGSADAVLSARWEEVVATLQRLPPGSLPTSFRQFQLALSYARMASADLTGSAVAQSIEFYHAGLQRQPRYVPAHANLAALYWQRGDLAAARHELVQVTQLWPVEPLYKVNLGLLEEQAGNERDAIDWYAQALMADPAIVASLYWQQNAWRSQHWPLIRETAYRLIERQRTGAARALLLGQLAYHSNDLEMAMRAFRSVLSDKEYETEGLRWLARTLVAQGNYAEALHVFEELFLRLSGQALAQEYRYRGRAQLALRREEAALRDFQTAWFMGDGQARYELGQVMARRGRVVDAIALYRELTVPPNVLYGLNLQFDFLFYRSGLLGDSNLLPVAAMPPSPAQAAIYLELAQLYAAQGECDQALEVCRELLQLVPGYPPAVEQQRMLEQEAEGCAQRNKNHPSELP